MSNPTKPSLRQPRHERLTVWQATDDLTHSIYRITFTTLKKEVEIGDELRTSAVAAVSHIVTGAYERDKAGFRRQLDVTIGKLARIDSTWDLVRELKLVNPEVWGEIEAKRDHAERLARGLYVALGRKEAGAKAKAAVRR
jgi:four helix bundle protein